MTKYKEEYIHSDHLLYIQLGENVRKLRTRFMYLWTHYLTVLWNMKWCKPC